MALYFAAYREPIAKSRSLRRYAVSRLSPGLVAKFFKEYKRIRLNWAAFMLACPGLADSGDKCNSETVLQVGGSSNVEWTSDGSQINIARSC